MKIYCVSDLHIGYEHTNYKKIQEFFNLVETDATKLVLCGDVLDLWRCPMEKIRADKRIKGTFNALCTLAESVDITYVWGNHDYEILKKWKEAADIFKVTDRFKSDSENIFYCHGWRFDVQQRFGSWLYGWLLDKFPYFYQKFIKTPFEVKTEEEGHKVHNLLCDWVHNEAKTYIKKNDFKYLIMGHTHEPGIDGKLIDCGDMVDSLSYVIIEDGKPELKKLPRKNK